MGLRRRLPGRTSREMNDLAEKLVVDKVKDALARKGIALKEYTYCDLVALARKAIFEESQMHEFLEFVLRKRGMPNI